MSALLPIADIRQRIEHVCFVPEVDTASVTKVSREDGAACLQVLCAKKTQETMSQVPVILSHAHARQPQIVLSRPTVR